MGLTGLSRSLLHSILTRKGIGIVAIVSLALLAVGFRDRLLPKPLLSSCYSSSMVFYDDQDRLLR